MKQAMIDYTQKPKGDEFYTPKYAVTPLLKYLLKPQANILCPFDTLESNYVKVLRKAGHNVYFAHKDDGWDFFKIEEWIEDFKLVNGVNHFDYIISNPPYSTKNQVLEKLYELGIPFAMLMPLTTFETPFRSKLFKEKGLEVLIFDKRINFVKNKSSNWFNTSYFCNQILPKDLIFETLEKDND